MRSIVYSTIILGFFSQLHAEQGSFFFDTAALYYQAQVDGLGYVTKDRSVKNPSFEWDFGFKVALGYQFPRDLWAVALRATSLQTHTDGLIRGEGLIPLWLSTPLLVDSAKMHWRLHLGVFDALLFRKFAATETLLLQPQIGISGTVARQKFSVDYASLVEVRTKNKFFGIGPYVGLFTQWLLKRGAFLFAEVGFRDLYGEFYLHQDEDLLHTKEKVLGVHNVYWQGAAIWEMLFGLGWDWDFSGSLKRLGCRLSWDQWLFFSQNQLMRFQDPQNPGQFLANQGDLGLGGLELGFYFTF